MKILAKCLKCQKIKPVWTGIGSESYCKKCSELNKINNTTKSYRLNNKRKDNRMTIKWRLGEE